MITLIKFAILFLAASIASCQAQVTDKMLWALGQIETGATQYGPCRADRLPPGAAGELGRFQIKPMFLTRAERAATTNPDVMRGAARRIWGKRMDLYVAKHGQKPTLVGCYLLWNSPAYPLGWNTNKTPAVCIERAQRFANLAE